MYDVKETSVDKASGERRCSATAMLNAGGTKIQFRVFKKGNHGHQFYVEWGVDSE